MRKSLASCLAFALLFCFCAEAPPQTAGGSTDTGNPAVCATVRYPDGTPAAGAAVIARPEDYLSAIDSTGAPERGCETTTDASGGFTIDSLEAGAYRIEVNDRTASAALFDIAVVAPGSADIIDAGEQVLQPYATLTGAIDTAGTHKPAQRWYIQVYGLERLIPIDSTGSYEIADLPEGNYRLRVIGPDSTMPPVQTDSVHAIADTTIEVPTISAGRYSCRLLINTSTTGADVPGDVHGFPLLVRLDTAVFDFSQAVEGGADMRFLKPDGTPLPHEIELWDTAAGLAAIWVRVDTVFGNDDSQYLWMQWGVSAGSAIVSQPSGAVFDSRFAGVWHLGDTAADGSAHDASVNGNHGMAPIPLDHGSGRTDIAGKALYLRRPTGWDDTVASVRVPDHGSLRPRSFTVSAWIRPDTLLQPMFRYVPRVMSKGDTDSSGAGFLFGSLWYDQNQFGLMLHSPDTTVESHRTGYEETAIRQWVHVCATVDENTVRVYRNGLLMAERLLPPAGFVASQGDLRLGFAFEGYIDEARIHAHALDPYRIRLSYETQREGATVVTYSR